jgi:hypothetical protein
MGFLTDLFKEIPLSAVLKEKIATFEGENAALKTEVAILKDDKRKLEAENKRLKNEKESFTHTDDLHESVVKTLVLLNSFRNNLPKHSVDGSEINEYHELLSTVEDRLGCDLSEFHIPVAAIKYRVVSQSVSFDEWGNTSQKNIPTEEYCLTTTFKWKLDGVIHFIASLLGDKGKQFIDHNPIP